MCSLLLLCGGLFLGGRLLLRGSLGLGGDGFGLGSCRFFLGDRLFLGSGLVLGSRLLLLGSGLREEQSNRLCEIQTWPRVQWILMAYLLLLGGGLYVAHEVH